VSNASIVGSGGAEVRELVDVVGEDDKSKPKPAQPIIIIVNWRPREVRT
jgi:hypothetical protein